MPRYIDADALLFELSGKDPNTHIPQYMIEYSALMSKIIDEYPKADVRKVIHAHWVKAERRGCTTYHDSYSECSNCRGEPLQFCRDFKYCPWCGAMMDEKEEE